MPLTNHEILLRVCQYIRVLNLPNDVSDDCLKKTTRYLESDQLPPQPEKKLRAALKFLRSSVASTFSVPDGLRPITRSILTYRAFSEKERDEEYRRLNHDAKDPTASWIWKRHARNRRVTLLVLLAIAFYFGLMASAAIFSGSGIPGLTSPIIVLSSLLFAWVALNCVTTLFGFLLFLKGRDAFNPANVLDDKNTRLSEQTSVAVLLPIYNEDPAQIFAGLRVMYESLRATSKIEQFTFFILSDTQDPDVWVDEEVAWRAFCDEYQTHGRVVYRHRKSRVGRKSGNIADFCRRWGKPFHYMIVLDSDSLIDGKTLVQLATIMDARPDIGILQTSPQQFNAKTLLARLQQFASQAYGPLFTLGLYYWQLGDAAYWGHNAIIRVEPFMKYCMLPKTRGRLPFAGMILSHDSIEAALMRRAGWGVWIAPSLSGSFEQPPSTMTTELTRDARWCRGNIQHLRLLGLKGLTFGHRWILFNGNLFYGASFLWMLLLFLVTANSIAKNFFTPNYFPHEMSLFPEWPIQHVGIAHVLLAVTITYLLLPKCLALIATAAHRKTRHSFGGFFRLTISAIIEMICSSLLAPLRMVLHSYHVLTALAGRRFDWHVSSRSTTGISFWDALKIGALPMVMGFLIAFILSQFDRTLFWWTATVSVPLFLSIPLSVFVSRGDWGEFFKRWGLLRVPTETSPTPEIDHYESLLTISSRERRGGPVPHGFIAAVVNPAVQHLHRHIVRQDRQLHPTVRSRRRAVADDALKNGPQRLNDRLKKEILCDPQLLASLHEEVWSLPEKEFALWFAR